MELYYSNFVIGRSSIVMAITIAAAEIAALEVIIRMTVVVVANAQRSFDYLL